MKPLWAIQGGIINDNDAAGMLDAIRELGLPHEILKVAPFDYINIPDINYDGPIIPYGGTKLLDAIRMQKKWCCWFNDNFKYSIALSRYKEHMFNSDAEFMKLKDFCPSKYPKKEYLFIRPDKDLKEFAGSTIKPRDFSQWLRQMKAKDLSVADSLEDTDILIAQASRIECEWRVFVVNKEPIDASLYRKNHYMNKDRNVPSCVFDFAKEMIKIWQPSDVFVMDICSLNDDLYILEVGDFHSAGWYETDKKKIIGAVSDFAMRYQ